MRNIAIIGAGAGGAAAVAELTLAGHQVSLWNRSAATLAPFQALGGVAYDGLFGEGVARPRSITTDLGEAIAGADVILVCLPTFSHASIARALAGIGSTTLPVVLNPGHTGGALEFREAFKSVRPDVPPIAEFSTLTYVARKYAPDRVSITGAVNKIRIGALPGGRAAAQAGSELYPAAMIMPDVLACDLANVNMVLHPPGAVLAAAWVEATGGDFTFYVQAMTPGVGRVMQALDDERRAVARAFGHELPPLIEEMQGLGTVEASVKDTGDLVGAISSGKREPADQGARLIPASLLRRGFRPRPVAFPGAGAGGRGRGAGGGIAVQAGRGATGTDYEEHGRTAARMGIAGLDRQGVLNLVKGMRVSAEHRDSPGASASSRSWAATNASRKSPASPRRPARPSARYGFPWPEAGSPGSRTPDAAAALKGAQIALFPIPGIAASGALFAPAAPAPIIPMRRCWAG